MLADAAGRTLSQDLASRRTQPPLPVSAMDGYAVRGEDVDRASVTLRQIGAIPAGAIFDRAIASGETVRIFTGAALPPGADTIVIQENVDADGDRITVREATTPGRYVRKAGLDLREGEIGLRAGRRLTPRDIGMAAGMNYPWLPVRRRPRIALLATGDEIVLPGETAGARTDHRVQRPCPFCHDIRLRRRSHQPRRRPRRLRRSSRGRARGADGADMLVTLGGASVGDHDLVQSALAEHGLEVDFWKIAMRPGKPLMFGQMRDTLVLGFPGNPVSTMVCALLFLQPLIAAFLGRPDVDEHRVRAHLAAPLAANDIREDYLRGELSRDEDGRLVARAFDVQDSSMFSLLAGADCLIVRPPHAAAAPAGALVDILPFDWNNSQF